MSTIGPMLLGVALVRGMLVGLRVMCGVGRLGGFAWLGEFGGCGWFGRLGGLCGGFAWLLCRGCLSWLSRKRIHNLLKSYSK